MKFRMQAQDLAKALTVVDTVPPGKNVPGYLFVVKGDKCRINSRGGVQCIRTEVPIMDPDGDGFFIYPADKISGLKYVDGWVQIEAGHDEKDDRYWIRYETEGGAASELGGRDPNLLKSLDEDLEMAGVEHTFPAALLREGIQAAKEYLASADSKNRLSHELDHFKTLQLFDKSRPEWEKGNGCLFAADNIRSCTFQCQTFADRGLAIHGQNVSAILTFLGKCSGDVTVKVGETMDFLIDPAGHVLGWAHHVKQHGQFKYYPDKLDRFALMAPKEPLVKALRHVQTELSEGQDKINVQYDHEKRTLRFQASGDRSRTRSVPVPVDIVTNADTGLGADGSGTSFSSNVNIKYLLDLVEPVRGHQVEIRGAVVKAKKEGQRDFMLFRTVEEFWLSNSGKLLISPQDAKDGAHQCRVTRFMPSKD